MSTKTNKQNVVYSYLRHLAVTSAGIALAVVKAKHIPLLHLTKTDLLTIANSVWLAVLPQVRFAVKPYITRYLKKNPDFFVFLLQYLPSNIVGAFTAPGDALPTATQVPATQNVVMNFTETPTPVEVSNPVVETSIATKSIQEIPVTVEPVITPVYGLDVDGDKVVSYNNGLNWFPVPVEAPATPVIPSVNG